MPRKPKNTDADKLAGKASTATATLEPPDDATSLDMFERLMGLVSTSTLTPLEKIRHAKARARMTVRYYMAEQAAGLPVDDMKLAAALAGTEWDIQKQEWVARQTHRLIELRETVGTAAHLEKLIERIDAAKVKANQAHAELERVSAPLEADVQQAEQQLQQAYQEKGQIERAMEDLQLVTHDDIADQTGLLKRQYATFLNQAETIKNEIKSIDTIFAFSEQEVARWIKTSNHPRFKASNTPHRRDGVTDTEWNEHKKELAERRENLTLQLPALQPALDEFAAKELVIRHFFIFGKLLSIEVAGTIIRAERDIDAAESPAAEGKPAWRSLGRPL